MYTTNAWAYESILVHELSVHFAGIHYPKVSQRASALIWALSACLDRIILPFP